MKKIFMLLVAQLLLAPMAFGDDYGYGSDDSDDSSGYKYESSTGTRYKYDLSNPSDRVMYDVDPAAQLMDSINPNPLIELDRDMNQSGGGAEW